MIAQADPRVEALARQRYINLTTFRRNGRPVGTPVWFVLDDGRILVYTEKQSGKAKRIRASKRATVAPCDVRGRVTGDVMMAYGRELPRAEHARALRMLESKYRLAKPLVDGWHSIVRSVGRKPKRPQTFLEITLDR